MIKTIGGFRLLMPIIERKEIFLDPAELLNDSFLHNVALIANMALFVTVVVALTSSGVGIPGAFGLGIVGAVPASYFMFAAEIFAVNAIRLALVSAYNLVAMAVNTLGVALQVGYFLCQNPRKAMAACGSAITQAASLVNTLWNNFSAFVKGSKKVRTPEPVCIDLSSSKEFNKLYTMFGGDCRQTSSRKEKEVLISEVQAGEVQKSISKAKSNLCSLGKSRYFSLQQSPNSGKIEDSLVQIELVQSSKRFVGA